MILITFGAATALAAPSPELEQELRQRLVQQVQSGIGLRGTVHRLGTAGMRRALGAPDRAVRAAAVAAAPVYRRAWQLLPLLLRPVLRAGVPRDEAARRARAVRLIAADLRLWMLSEGEGLAQLHLAVRQLAAACRNEELAVDVRKQCILALGHLCDLLSDAGESSAARRETWWALMGSRDARIRRAALALASDARAPGGPATLAAVMATDRSQTVALAAAAVLCAAVPLSDGGPRSAPMRALEQNPAAGARLLHLSESVAATDDELLDLARCLDRDRTQAARAALHELLQRRSPRWRRLWRARLRWARRRSSPSSG